MTALTPDNTAPNQHVIFFDGMCALCNAFVDFIMKRDKKNRLRFAPLQGETAKEYALNMDAADLKTVIFYCNGILFTRSDAVIEIFRSMGGIWKLAVILKIFPKKLRDFVYNIVAQNRIKWFGQKETCRMPTANEKGKLLN